MQVVYVQGISWSCLYLGTKCHQCWYSSCTVPVAGLCCLLMCASQGSLPGVQLQLCKSVSSVILVTAVSTSLFILTSDFRNVVPKVAGVVDCRLLVWDLTSCTSLKAVTFQLGSFGDRLDHLATIKQQYLPLYWCPTLWCSSRYPSCCVHRILYPSPLQTASRIPVFILVLPPQLFLLHVVSQLFMFAAHSGLIHIVDKPSRQTVAGWAKPSWPGRCMWTFYGSTWVLESNTALLVLCRGLSWRWLPHKNPGNC